MMTEPVPMCLYIFKAMISTITSVSTTEAIHKKGLEGRDSEIAFVVAFYFHLLLSLLLVVSVYISCFISE